MPDKYLTKSPFYSKSIRPHSEPSTKKYFFMKTSSLDILCATDEEEFYYKDTDQVVEVGDPIGIDVDHGDEVELVLFSNIYWKPNYE
tara:strand:- start:1525 stop:1785 length:261 start_codon:yes stop_codon:yes gene_type:complete